MNWFALTISHRASRRTPAPQQTRHRPGGHPDPHADQHPQVINRDTGEILGALDMNPAKAGQPVASIEDPDLDAGWSQAQGLQGPEERKPRDNR